MTTKLLAWCQYPEPHGTGYTDADFSDRATVIQVLDRAQVLRAYITPEGWQALWKLYGLRGLLDLNRKGKWFDTKDESAAAAQIVHRSRVAGCDVSFGKPGEPELETGAFALSGNGRA